MTLFGIGSRLLNGISRMACEPMFGALNQARFINLTATVNNVRCHFPRPNEVKRQRHSWKTRLSTLNGRRILMRRILKGRHVLAH